MMMMTKDDLKRRITDLFEDLFPSTTDDEVNLVPKRLTDGKLYEAYVLAVVAEKLSIHEGYSLKLVNSNHIQLKSGRGPINRRYPYIQINRKTNVIAEVWTDVEYLTLSYEDSRRSVPNKGDYHELDILMVNPGINGRPRHNQIWLGVECKNVQYKKGLLREILGVRRELSLLKSNQKTNFTKWPRSYVPADPPSCLLVFSSSNKIMEYSDPGDFFGIDFIHEKLPI